MSTAETSSTERIGGGLVVFSDIERALAEAETIEDFVDVAKMARVAEELARQGNLGVGAQNRAVEYRVRAYAGAADVVDKMPTHRGGRGKTSNRRVRGLPDHVTLQRWRDARTAHRRGWQDTLDPGSETSFAMYVAEGVRVRSGITPGESDEWYTPRWLFEQLGLVFDLDVCAPADPAMRNAPAIRYYTETDDGLAQPWEGLVWCNPPYSDPSPWITRWAGHDSGLLLTHFSVASRRMPELWGAEHGIVFFAGMHFERPNGELHKPYWGIQLAARGAQAVEALYRIDNEWASPVLRPTPWSAEGHHLGVTT